MLVAMWTEELRLALSLVDDADAVSMSRFRAADLSVETKPDTTPVTDADRRVESLVRKRLGQLLPRDAVLGEEEGETGSGAARRWVLDPIDGTKNFARGVPVWATLLALEAGGEVVVGVVSAPALARRWWATRGGGAYVAEHGAAPRRLAVSAVQDLADASLSYSSLPGWQPRDGFLALTDAVWRSRAYGDFWSYVLVAEGGVDIAAEPAVSRWDLAAVSILVTEAGGRFSNLRGEPGPGGGSAVASNGLLHEQVLGLLA